MVASWNAPISAQSSGLMKVKAEVQLESLTKE